MTSAFQSFFFVSMFLLCLHTAALAQDDFINSSAQQESMKVEGRVEKKYIMKLEAPTFARKYCHVSVDTNYLQKDTSAIVEMILDNPDCAASSGSYTVAVRVRDENNESRTISFDETWQREDDHSLESRQDYFIRENVDLVNVRVNKLKCVCTEIADEVSNPYKPTP